MKHLILRAAAFSMSAATVVAIPATAAHAQHTLHGSYVNAEDGAKWVLENGKGKFYQYKSINGNPGTIVTDVTYEIVNGGKTFDYTMIEIRLEDHPMGHRSQRLNKSSTEPIEIRANSFVMGGKVYARE